MAPSGIKALKYLWCTNLFQFGWDCRITTAQEALQITYIFEACQSIAWHLTPPWPARPRINAARTGRNVIDNPIYPVDHVGLTPSQIAMLCLLEYAWKAANQTQVEREA